MASSDVRQCPHCGFSVSGDTNLCPNCDRPLAADIDTRPATSQQSPDDEQPPLDEADALTMLDTSPSSDTPAEQADDLPETKAPIPTRGPTPMQPPKTQSAQDDEEDQPQNEVSEPIMDASLLETRDPGGDELPPELQTGIVETPTPLGAQLPGVRPRAEEADADEQEEVTSDEGTLGKAADKTVLDDADPFATRPDIERDKEAASEAPPPFIDEPPAQADDTPSAAGDRTPPQEIAIPYSEMADDAAGEDEDASAAEMPPVTELPDIKTHALPGQGQADDATRAEGPVVPPAPAPEPEPLPPLEERTAERQASPPSTIEIPSAPFTPPPPDQPAQAGPYQPGTPTLPYSQQPPQSAQTGWHAPPSDYWLQQRLKAYEMAGYKIERQGDYDALLNTGKRLPFVWWVVAGASLVGAAWYFLILLASGFKREKVYIGLEPDGYVFEEGPAAAHIRRRRARTSRRWGVAGVVLGLVSVLFFFMLVIAGSVVISSYQAELYAAFPELTFFAEGVDTSGVTQGEVDDMRLIVGVMIVLFTVALLGIIGGFVLTVISYIQAAAYQVDVAPLPGYE